MPVKRQKRHVTLRDLIREELGEDVETDSPFSAENDQTSAIGQVPEFYLRIKDHMKDLEKVEHRLEKKAKIDSNYFLRCLYSTYEQTVRLFDAEYRNVTVDDLVEKQIGIMDTLNSDVRQAIDHSLAESNHLQSYGNGVMDDFEKAKTGMQECDDNYGELQRVVNHFESRLLELNMEDGAYTETRRKHDDAKRGLQRAQNMREGYATRVKVRLVQRKTVLMKEEKVRTILYELQKMGDNLGMFLEEVQQTSDATALSQYAYQTAEALRDSYGILSGISQSRSIIEKDNVGRLMTAVNDTNYNFPQETLRAVIEQSRELKEIRNVSVFEEMKSLLSEPAFEKRDSKAYARDYDSSVELPDML